MAGGDFNLDDDYNVDMNEFNNNNDNQNNQNNNQYQTNEMNQMNQMGQMNQSNNASFGFFGGQNLNMQNQNIIDDSNVIFEDIKNETGAEKLKYFLSTVNKKIVILAGIALGILLMVIIIISSVISSINKSYKTIAEIPDTVYVGETADFTITAKGKSGLNKTETNFTIYKYEIKDNEEDYSKFSFETLKSEAEKERIDDTSKMTHKELESKLFEKQFSKRRFTEKDEDGNIVSIEKSTVTGKETTNTFIPIQEGRVIVGVYSKLNSKKMADYKKLITVCPSFTKELVLGENISLQENSVSELNIDFGIGECSRDIAYESSNEGIFTINEDGRIRGISKGQAVLTVRKDNRQFSVPVYITEDTVRVKSYMFTPKNNQIEVGQTFRINAKYLPVNATNTRFEFSSSDSTIAKVSEDGVVTGLKPGTVEIDCSFNTVQTPYQIKVTVYKGENKTGTPVTALNIEENEINLIKGASKKIIASVSPENAKDKTLSYESSDLNVATVNVNGIVYAKNKGNCIINVITSNNIKKEIKVNVSDRKSPEIIASDKIESGDWHQKPYTLTFEGADSGSNYYYYTSESKTLVKSNTVEINKDGKITYYIKACSGKSCSNTVEYISQLDSVKPVIQSIAQKTTTSVVIAIKDNNSTVNRVCVTKTNDKSKCKFNYIKAQENPIVSFTAKANGTYYVFAKDVAGNTSESKSFDIVGVEE